MPNWNTTILAFLGSKISNARVRVGGTNAFSFFSSIKAAALVKHAFQQASKKKRGVGGNEFLPVCLPCEAGLGVGALPQFCVSRISKQKNFHLLNSKNFCERAIKKMFKRFFCFARRSEAEAGGNAGWDYSKSACGFCSKKVRISSKRHRQRPVYLPFKLTPYGAVDFSLWLSTTLKTA